MAILIEKVGGGYAISEAFGTEVKGCYRKDDTTRWWCITFSNLVVMLEELLDVKKERKKKVSLVDQIL